jgi:hypothetical protein
MKIHALTPEQQLRLETEARQIRTITDPLVLQAVAETALRELVRQKHITDQVIMQLAAAEALLKENQRKQEQLQILLLLRLWRWLTDR